MNEWVGFFDLFVRKHEVHHGSTLALRQMFGHSCAVLHWVCIRYAYTCPSFRALLVPIFPALWNSASSKFQIRYNMVLEWPSLLYLAPSPAKIKMLTVGEKEN